MTLAELQKTFAQSLRNPDSVCADTLQIEPHRHAIYRDLIFNNISSLLLGTFPVLHTTLKTELWNELIRQFLIQHRAQTPLFPKLPEEFLQFIQKNTLPDSTPEWLSELAHYEWIELALELENIDDVENFLKTKHTHLSPLAVLLIYRFPVNLISPDFLPKGDTILEPTCLLAYRAFDYKSGIFSDKVKFMLLTSPAARLLEILEEHSDIDQISNQLADELQQNVEDIKAFALQFLSDLSAKGIIFGLEENT